VTNIYLEVGQKRVFACAVEWPGWSRSGRDEAQALAALAAYAPRYALIALEAGVRFPASHEVKDFEVVERLPGSAGTEFGAPGGIPYADTEPLKPADTRRLAKLLEASWAIFDRVAAGAPAALRKGPRGGGRDRDKIVEHVLGAEVGYASKLGARLKQPLPNDTRAIAQHRLAVLEALRNPGKPPKSEPWPARYFVRRTAWHVLDHAWEIEDRSQPD
jgi:hypothetical protein